MKIFRHSLLLAIMFGIVFQVNAQSEKQKEINKSYKVNGNTVLDITNKFGKVHVNTWDKAEMTVNVKVTAEAKTEDKAMEMLKKIDITIDESSDRKRFETSISNKLNSNGRESFSIDYEVYMPKGNRLELKNSFGNSYISNHSGETEVDISYGDIKAGRLTGKTDFKLSFGSGDIEEIGGGDLTIKYSKLDIEKVGNIDLTQGFSDVEIDQLGNVDLESKYGSLEFGVVESVSGKVGFSGFEIDRLNKSLKLVASYVSGFRIDEVSKDFDYIDIEGKFGNYNIILEEGATPSIEAEFEFASMSYDKDEIKMSYVEKEMHSASYKGKIGNGQKGTIKVESSYGDLRLGF